MTDAAETPWYVDFALPVLLGEARKAYGQAIHGALAAAGYTDVPRTGPRVLGGLARAGAPLRDVAEELGVSKQAASQLVDALVLRGYVTREPDPEDRRRMVVVLTERGRGAAEVVRGAIGRVDGALAEQVGADDVLALRRASGALCRMAWSHG
jgi:DNA-binding MarR family transcriptional regulator